MDNNCKPPIGLKPRWLHETNRIQDIIDAIKRYSEAKEPIPIEWVDELNELTMNLYKR